MGAFRVKSNNSVMNWFQMNSRLELLEGRLLPNCCRAAAKHWTAGSRSRQWEPADRGRLSRTRNRHQNRRRNSQAKRSKRLTARCSLLSVTNKSLAVVADGSMTGNGQLCVTGWVAVAAYLCEHDDDKWAPDSRARLSMARTWRRGRLVPFVSTPFRAGRQYQMSARARFLSVLAPHFDRRCSA